MEGQYLAITLENQDREHSMNEIDFINIIDELSDKYELNLMDKTINEILQIVTSEEEAIILKSLE